MNDPLHNRFKMQIKALNGFDFQDFVMELFLLKHGTTNFTVLRKIKDKGCDGVIVTEKRVIACYGPEENIQKKFEKKADEDFEDFINNWQTQYPNWMFVVNHDVTPLQISKIESLKKKTPLLGIKNILSIIEELDNYKKRKLAKYLKIENDFIAKDYLREILDDLLKNSASDEPRKAYVKPIYFTDKVKLNFDAADVEDVLNEYDLVYEYFFDIEGLIYGYEDDEIDRIKHRIVTDFAQTKGEFKERFESQTNLYLSKYLSEADDDYKFYVRALLIYIFEQCLIGSKTDKEKEK